MSATEGRTRRGVLALASLGCLLLACDRRVASTPPGPAAPTRHPADAAMAADEAPFLSVSGHGASREEAYRAARDALAQALLGDPAWLEIVPLAIHEPDVDAQSETTREDGTVEVTLSLSRARASALLGELRITTPKVQVPAPWHDTVYAFVFAHAGAHACVRRRVLFGVECEEGDTREFDAALQQLAQGVSLTPLYAGGVPLDPQGKPLRQPAVYVHWRGVPASGVPLEARPSSTVEASRLTARTDMHGVARFDVSLDQPLTTPVRVTLGTQAILGPLHASWPEVTVAIEGRPADLRRWSAVVVERGAAAPSASSPVGEGLSEALAGAGMGSGVDLPSDHARALMHATGEARSERLRQVADALAGRVDVVFVATVGSRFANKMGGTRVWYEASADLEVYDAWTGRLLTRMRKSATASGIDNDRADRAARRQLGAVLAGGLLETAEVPRPSNREAVACAAERPTG